MLRLRLEEHPAPTGQKDADMLLGWVLDTLGLVRRRADSMVVGVTERPLHRLMREHFLVQPSVAKSAAELAAQLGISATALHHHLGRLHSARIIANSSGDDGWKHHFIRCGSLNSALDLLAIEARHIIAMQLAPLAEWRVNNGGPIEGAEDLDCPPFRLVISEPHPFDESSNPLDVWLADLGLLGERPRAGDDLARTVFSHLLAAERPLSLDEGVHKWKVTRPRLQRTLDRLRSAGMVERIPRWDRLSVILWDAISSQYARRGEEWLRGRGGFGRIPKTVADSTIKALNKGNFTAESCAKIMKPVSIEDQMLLLNLLGGRLPHGYRLVGDSGEDVIAAVLTHVDSTFMRLKRVANRLTDAIAQSA